VSPGREPHSNTPGHLYLAYNARNIAAALRRNARDATRVLPLLGITSP
jgi:hypothetical protein